MTLTPSQVREFEERGFVFGVAIVDRPTARRYRRCWDELEARERMRETGLTRQHSRHLDQDFVWEIATHPKLLDCVEQLLGPDVLLFGTRFFCKQGRESKFVAWHQDVLPATWNLSPPLAVTAWYAFDDCDPGNGCMRMLPGSHRAGIREHGVSGHGRDNLLRLDQEVAVDPREAQRAVDIVLRSGEISIHHGAVLHTSAPNVSGRRRCGLACRYVPTYVKQLPGDQPRSSPILVRGHDREGHFGDTRPEGRDARA